MIKNIIHNVITGEETVVDFSDKELAEIEAQRAEAEAERIANEQAELERLGKLESAKSKLAALGLSDDEVAALIG